MAESARLESIDSLKLLRAALFKFQETANVALNDAEAEMQHVLLWLELEQISHWQTQIRKRSELVARAKEAVRMKEMYKDSSGRSPTAFEERKALALAERRLEEAEHKLDATKRSIRILQREIQMYKGTVQRFATTVQADIPVAAAHLDSMMATLEEYVSLSPEAASSAAPPSVAGEILVEPPPAPEADESADADNER